MVMVLDAQAAETPVGKPVAAPIPEAPVVAIVIAVNALLMHNEGDEEAVAAVLAGFTVTAKDCAEDVPQLLPAVTVIFPFCPADPVVTVMVVEPAPAVIVQPVGTVQVYVVAFATEAIE
jgi:hypothetical protein